jgi:hypothetical protein
MIMLGGRGEGADFGGASRSREMARESGRQAENDDYGEFSNESLTPSADDDLPF